MLRHPQAQGKQRESWSLVGFNSGDINRCTTYGS
jgi:hypothetical protein